MAPSINGMLTIIAAVAKIKLVMHKILNRKKIKLLNHQLLLAAKNFHALYRHYHRLLLTSLCHERAYGEGSQEIHVLISGLYSDLS